MLIRSYHKILLRLSRSFCTDQGNKGSNNNQPGQVSNNEKKMFEKQKQKGGSDKKWGKNWAGKHKNTEQGKFNQAQSNVRSEQQKLSPNKQGVFKHKHKKDEAHQIKNRKDETNETRNRKSDDGVKQRQQKNVKKQHPKTQVDERFDWQQNKISKEKKRQHQQQEKMKQSFLEHYKNQTIRAELQKEMKQKKSGQNLNLVTNMQFYFEENSKEASQFFMAQILPFSKNQEAFQKTATKIFQAALFKYIEKQRYSDLLLFLSGLGDNHNLKINNQTIFQYIELIFETSSQASKYTIISLLLDLVNAKNMSKNIEEAIGVGKQILRSYCNSVAGKSEVKSEERHLIINLVNKLAQKKFISSSIFSSKIFNLLVEKIYFPLGSYQLNGFMKFLHLIEQGKTESKLHYSQFYFNFEKSIENYLLSKTDCQGLPAYINSNFFQTYQRCLKDNNWYGILTLIALSLTNKYTSIAQHFLKEGKKKFPYKTQNSTLLKQLQDKFRLQRYENIFSNSTQNAQITQLQSNIKKGQRIQNKLMLAIIKKDYEEAMNIFNNSIFYPMCVNKQGLIIKKVLKDFIKEQKYTNNQVNSRELNMKIDAFVEQLDKGYLLESWKKGEDLGYLLEDYYIKQGDAAQSKAQKRFSFYDSFFEIKRAKQINKLQKINELHNYKQGQPESLLENQFNLNKYLEGESYTRYREVADYNDQKQQQLAEYFIKIQHGLEYLEKEAENKQQYKAKLVSFQKNLCEENLKLLEDFGLRDYDLTQYDIKEFKNRMKNFKKFRGVLRVADIDKRIFPDQNQFEFLHILYEEKYEDHKKMREGKGRKSRKSAMDESSILQQQGEDIPEQIKEEVEQEVIEAQIKEEEEIVEQPESKKKYKNKKNASEGEEGEAVEAGEVAAVAEEGGQDVEGKTEQPMPIIDHISTKNPAQILKQAQSLDKFLTTEFVDILRVQRREEFQRARQGILFKQHSLAYELILWGVFNKHPMAIYMGQKLYMLSNRKIPHKLAIRVSDFLSHRRQQNEQKIKDCKICLSYIGRIQREFIYNENYDYHHIHSRPFLKNQIRNYNNQLKQRLNDLIYESNQPALLNMQIREQIKKVEKGSLV